MTTQNARRIETEADTYWREKTARRQDYGFELAVVALFLAIMVLN